MAMKVTEIEKKYEGLSKAKDSSDSMCEHAEQGMSTAQGISEDDNLSSISVASEERKGLGAESRVRR